MTDGILLAETQNDPYLNEYDTIIVDEAHERSLNIDFILGILKTLLKQRKDLKIVITSATIDTEKFSKAFGNAPVIEVSGRMYPVEDRYFPVDPKFEEGGEQTHVEMAVRAVDKIQQESIFGDILVFMPTEQDIRETCELIEGRNYKDLVIFPLFARLAASEQSRVFSHVPGRKIIIATNIAETSLTIPGIKYVIDTVRSGRKRCMHPTFSRRGLSSTPTFYLARDFKSQPRRSHPENDLSETWRYIEFSLYRQASFKKHSGRL
jgi:ATP-dependent helicase HrpA